MAKNSTDKLAIKEKLDTLKSGDTVYLFPEGYSVLDGCIKATVTDVFEDRIRVWADFVSYAIYKDEALVKPVYRNVAMKYIMGNYFLDEASFINYILRAQREKELFSNIKEEE